jgi:hypothetical protein
MEAHETFGGEGAGTYEYTPAEEDWCIKELLSKRIFEGLGKYALGKNLLGIV